MVCWLVLALWPYLAPGWARSWLSLDVGFCPAASQFPCSSEKRHLDLSSLGPPSLWQPVFSDCLMEVREKISVPCQHLWRAIMAPELLRMANAPLTPAPQDLSISWHISASKSLMQGLIPGSLTCGPPPIVQTSGCLLKMQMIGLCSRHIEFRISRMEAQNLHYWKPPQKMIFLITLTLTMTVVITLIMHKIEELKCWWWGGGIQRIKKPYAGSSVKIVHVKREKCLQVNSVRNKQTTCRNKDFRYTHHEIIGLLSIILAKLTCFRIILFLIYLMPEMSHLSPSFSSTSCGSCEPEWLNCCCWAEKSNQFLKPLFFPETDIFEVDT